MQNDRCSVINMKLIWIPLVGVCLLTISCMGIIDCYRPAENMEVRVVSEATVSHDLIMAEGNPVQIEKTSDSTFRLSIPPERYGGVMFGPFPKISDPEKIWQVNVLHGDSVIFVTTISKIRKLKKIDGIRTLTIKRD